MRRTLVRHTAAVLAVVAVLQIRPLAGQDVAARPPFTLQQLMELIAVRSPDAVVSREVEKRGVAFRIDDEQFARLRRAGARPATLKALSVFLVNTAVTVTTHPPGAEVLLNGRVVGRSGASGTFRLETRAGTHEVGARLPRHGDKSATVSLEAGGEHSVSLSLAMSVGVLDVTTSAPEASVTVTGLGNFKLPLRDLDVLPGSYVVSLSGPRLKASSQRVEVVPGQRVAVFMAPEVDPAYLTATTTEIGRLLPTAPSRAAALAEELVAAAPGNVEAAKALVAARYYANDFGRFEAAARRALELGGSVEVLTMHHHSVGSSHHAILRFSTAALSFAPLGDDCNQRQFEVPLAAVSVPGLKTPGGDEIYLSIEIKTDERNPKRLTTINLAHSSARVREVQRSTAGGLIGYKGRALVSGRQGREAMEAVQAALSQAKQLSGQRLPGPPATTVSVTPIEGAALVDAVALQAAGARVAAEERLGAVLAERRAWEGRAWNRQEGWPMTLSFGVVDGTGKFVGEVRWPSLANAVHRIEGVLVGDTRLVFRETAYIQRGKAGLGCSYELVLDGDSRLAGTYGKCPGGDSGEVELFTR